MGGTGEGMDRRDLIKAGLWAAPVLLLATATPAAAAASTPRSYLQFIGPWSWHPGDGAGYFGVNVQLQGEFGAQPNPVSNVIITLSVPESAGSGGTAEVALGDESWIAAAGGAPSGAGPYVYTFTYIGSIPLYSAGIQSLAVRIPVLPGVVGGYTVTFTAAGSDVDSIVTTHVASTRTGPPDPLPTGPTP
jgi:hypothetical protein